MKGEKVHFRSAGHELVGIAEFPGTVPAPGVVMFHGLTNTKEDCPLISETAHALVRDGFAVLRFDFFGSGESPGTMKEKLLSVLEQNARDAMDFFCADERVTDVGLWGRSTGGTIVALCGTDARVRASVMASPAVLLEDGFSGFRQIQDEEMRLEQSGRRLPGTGQYKGPFDLGEDFFKELGGLDQRIRTNLKQLSHVLVLGTTPDRKVSLGNATTAINIAREPKEIHIFENTDHDYKGKEEAAVQIIRSWFREHLAAR